MSSMELAKVVVARSANANHERVLVRQIWSKDDHQKGGELNVREVILEAV